MSSAIRHNLAVLAHPRRDSFNRALFAAATEALIARGETVEVSDLYAESFEAAMSADELVREHRPTPEVLREQARVARADRLLFFYPIWWFDRPAILKGWCDRVLRPGFAYRVDSSGAPRGLLGRKSAALVVTLGATEDQCSVAEVTDSMAHGTLGFCGLTAVRTRPLFGVPGAEDNDRRSMIERTAEWVVQA